MATLCPFSRWSFLSQLCERPLIESAEANQTPAERKLALYEGPWAGDIDRVFAEFAY